MTDTKQQAVFYPCSHETMHLQLDNGQERDCRILTLIRLDDKEYIALVPQDPSREDEAYLYGFAEAAGQPQLRKLTDPAELRAALDAFDQWYDQAESPVPVDVFSGFLGAGKTTLIKKLLAEVYAGERVALIENEFGDVNIDSGFLQDSGVEIREMNAGCICCSLVGDFTKSLGQVVEDLHPDRIIIEPSGVGKLSEIIRAVEQAAGDRLELSSASVVVDAGKAKMYMKNFGEFFNDQVEHAGAIILSHTDGLSPEKLAAAVELLRQHNQMAAIVSTPWDQLDGVQLMEAVRHTDSLERELAELAAQQAEQAWDEDEHEHHHHHHHDDEDEHAHHHHHDDEDEHEHHHHHDDEDEHEHHHHHDDEDEHEHGCDCGCDHDHDHDHVYHHDHEHHGHHHHADEVFVSWGRETTRSFSREELLSILGQLQQEDRFGLVLRAKGFVPDGSGAWLHFDYVPGEPEVREGSAAVIGRLCVIGSKLNEAALAELFGL